jgi:penicillin-binding protein 2
MVGVDKINKWATAFGLGVKSGIDLPNEITGIVPSTAWKLRTTGEKWYAGETTSVAIGQGQVTVTPMSMAVYMATLANGGTRVTPHLLKAVDDGGWSWCRRRCCNRRSPSGRPTCKRSGTVVDGREPRRHGR